MLASHVYAQEDLLNTVQVTQLVNKFFQKNTKKRVVHFASKLAMFTNVRCLSSKLTAISDIRNFICRFHIDMPVWLNLET